MKTENNKKRNDQKCSSLAINIYVCVYIARRVKHNWKLCKGKCLKRLKKL